MAEEAGDPSVCVRDGNGKWKVPPEEGSASKEELINMYSPTDTKVSPTAHMVGAVQQGVLQQFRFASRMQWSAGERIRMKRRRL